ncbi:MAG: ABC transporter ATP-binding protein [Dissulfurimicrobium sp.]|uniref:ABC transporter ATP-binding protein n=1 Tax=Dissulfurimicrobium TaxID=1769732 RepID=UPI001EDA96F1|nr:ABC transporter ATP-binding protein [Dissulfurimicrobium hydrothermale]UKL13744.1 ABC transporter ATP-binding protein [Dissulfurimicrobium hydrothermale]
MSARIDIGNGLHGRYPGVAIAIRGLSKIYSTNGIVVNVLKEIDCDIFEGDVVGVVGASGVGKTSLLHILGTLEPPSSGAVLHFGQNVFTWKDSMLSRFRNEQLGFVFQFHYLLPEFTAVENVMMPCLVAGVDRKEAKEAAMDILMELGLENRAEFKIGQLSGGEQQRIAFARAMVRRPRLLLADEPTGNLDEHTGEKLADLFFSLNSRYNTTMVIVTHNLALAIRMKRCLGLIDGKLVELASSELKDFGVGKARSGRIL